MAEHGVFVTEQPTSVGIPVTAASGVPFVIGTSPIQRAAKPAKVGVPVLIYGWAEAKEKFGYAEDWTKYNLSEFMFAHFLLNNVQPVIFVNLLDPVTHNTAVGAADIAVVDHKVKIDFGAINDATLIVKPETGTGTAYVKGEDYDVLYDDTDCYVVLLVGGDAYAATKLNVAYNKVNPAAVDAAAVAAGMEKIELCTTTLGMVPDLICAPGFSEDTAVAAVMAAKAAAINGMFRAKALIDIPTDSGKAAAYSDVLTYKNAQALVDENQILCWPLLTFGGKTYHFSTLLAGLMASIDAENSAPYVSPSNKAIKCDGMVDAAGAEINLTLDQANTLNAQGVLTALNFMGGWKAWGNYTACYPGSTDVKDMFIPVSRMFDWVANTLIQTFWSRIDMPMNRRLVDSILDTCNIWLNGLVGSGYLLGARCVMLEDENPLTSLMAGIIKLHVYITPPSPAQEIDFALEYDAAYVEAAFAQ